MDPRRTIVINLLFVRVYHNFACLIAIPEFQSDLSAKRDANAIIRGSCKKFCHWVRITSVLRFIKHIFITNLQSIPP